jgi:hypothetical protein
MDEEFGLSERLAMGVEKVAINCVQLRGHAKFELFGPAGELRETVEIDNLVTTAGKAGAAAQIASTPALPKWGWMAIGTGSPAATLLGSENARIAFSSNTSATNVDTVVATFGAGVGTGTITEAGTFDVVTANTVNMWTSATSFSITKGALDSLQITWTLTYN